MVGDSPDTDEGDRDVSSDISVDYLLDLLADDRRRYVLKCLREHDGAISMSDLAEDVAARETEEPRTAIEAEMVQRVATSLYHSHVPKLADVGVVEFDRDRNLVAASNANGSIKRVNSLLDSLAADGDEM